MIQKLSIYGIFIILCAVVLLGCGENTYYDNRLKMQVQRLDSDIENRWSTNGVVIRKIDDGPAKSAGLEVGELISHLIGERKIESVGDYKDAIKKGLDKDRKAKLVLSGREAPVDISIRKKGEKLGLKVSEKGGSVTITKVEQRSPAELAGIREGEVIQRVIDEKRIETLKDYKKAVKEIAKHDNKLTVYTSELSGIKLASIEALGGLGDSGALPELMKALESDNIALRRPAARALEQLSETVSSEELVELMIKHLQPANESDSDIRRSSAVILGKLKAKTAIPHLIAALGDPIPGVRFKAGIALSEIGKIAPDASAKALIKSLQQGNPSVQNIAASALGDIRGETARKALIAALNKNPELSVKLTIAEALAKIGDTKTLKQLDTKGNPGLQEFIKSLSKSAQL
ncbi:MAG: HEAT repeat domain-containing protein [Deltaproteobacteria bacterium]|nr:HEAT repeat domain-containing protein [Deltaproteobacteria bacterium]